MLCSAIYTLIHADAYAVDTLFCLIFSPLMLALLTPLRYAASLFSPADFITILLVHVINAAAMIFDADFLYFDDYLRARCHFADVYFHAASMRAKMRRYCHADLMLLADDAASYHEPLRCRFFWPYAEAPRV